MEDQNGKSRMTRLSRLRWRAQGKMFLKPISRESFVFKSQASTNTALCRYYMLVAALETSDTFHPGTGSSWTFVRRSSSKAT